MAVFLAMYALTCLFLVRLLMSRLDKRFCVAVGIMCVAIGIFILMGEHWAATLVSFVFAGFGFAFVHANCLSDLTSRGGPVMGAATYVITIAVNVLFWTLISTEILASGKKSNKHWIYLLVYGLAAILVGVLYFIFSGAINSVKSNGGG